MKVCKVSYKYDTASPVYFIVDELSDLDRLSKLHWPEAEIVSIDIISTNVVNQWAQ